VQDEDPERDPDCRSKSFEEHQRHRSALHYASESSAELTKILLEARADVNLKDAQAKQPLHLAIEARLLEVVDLLLEGKADVNTGNHALGLNSTPLIDAAYRSDCELVRKLIVASSDVNWQGKQGMTPLHMSARGKKLEIATMLLEAKADANIKAMGFTASELAVKNGHKEIASILGATYTGAHLHQPNDVAINAETRRQLYLD